MGDKNPKKMAKKKKADIKPTTEKIILPEPEIAKKIKKGK